MVDGAISLAVSYAAHLRAVSVGYEITSVGFPVEAGGAAVVAVFEIERERALARANAALAVFETEARNAGIAYNCQPIASVPVEAAASVSASARLQDLTIVLQPEPDRDTFDNVMSQEILFESGGPVLFIPYTHKGPLVAKRIGIAWDGSRLARARFATRHRSWLARRLSPSSVSTKLRARLKRPRKPYQPIWRGMA